MTTQDILVAEELDPASTELIYQAGGLITAEGAPDSIAALAAVELGIPAILQASGDWDELVDGQTIVIDARTGNVYEWDL
jgi:phosphohistidine swiveling domain-containing protein